MKKTTAKALHTLHHSDVTPTHRPAATARLNLQNPRAEPRVSSPVPWAAMGLARSPRVSHHTAKPRLSASLAAKLTGHGKARRARSPKGSAAEAVRKT